MPTLAVSGVIEHTWLDKGLNMIDKTGVEEKLISQKRFSNETNKQTKQCFQYIQNIFYWYCYINYMSKRWDIDPMINSALLQSDPYGHITQ